MADVYTDFSGLNRLKSAAANSKGAAEKESVNKEVAQQFEAMYLQMMLKSMRQSVGPGIMDSSQSEMAQGLYDQQLAIQLSKQGAIGIGDLVLRQIEGPKQVMPDKPELKFAPKIIDAALVTTNSQPEIIKTALMSRVAEPSIQFYQQPATPVFSNQFSRRNDKRPYETAVVTPQVIQSAQPVTAQQAFIAKIQPAAEAAATQLGVAPKAIIAIAALETGWGKHVMKTRDGQSSHNLFGIKADARWKNDHVFASTLEFENGAMQRKNEPFRVYGSATESVMDFARFIEQNPRYQKALLHSSEPERFIDEIHQAGYATDPGYAQKVKAVMQTIDNNTQDSVQLADTRE